MKMENKLDYKFKNNKPDAFFSQLVSQFTRRKAQKKVRKSTYFLILFDDALQAALQFIDCLELLNSIW